MDEAFMISKYDQVAGEPYLVGWSSVELGHVVLVHMVAEFARVKDAVAFRDRYLSGDGESSEGNVSQVSRTVRWDALMEDTGTRIREYVWDLAENAGCVGNYGGRKARVGFSRTEEFPAAIIDAPTEY